MRERQKKRVGESEGGTTTKILYNNYSRIYGIYGAATTVYFYHLFMGLFLIIKKFCFWKKWCVVCGILVSIS